MYFKNEQIIKWEITNNANLFFLKKSPNTLLIKVSNKTYKLDLTLEEKGIITKFFTNEIINVDSDLKRLNILSHLEDIGAIRSISSSELSYSNTKYEKTLKFFSVYTKDYLDIPSKLSTKKILIIGIGGVGCEIINHLVAVDIKNYILIDSDTINDTNLNRQFCFTPKDVGKYKATVVCDYIKDRTPAANVRIFNTKITNKNDLNAIIESQKNIDLIINCADTPMYEIQKIVLLASLKFKIPCIFAGIKISDGYFGPLLVKKSAKERFLKRLNFILDNSEPFGPCSGSFSPTNSMISSFLAKDIIFYLLGLPKFVKCLNTKVGVLTDELEISYEEI